MPQYAARLISAAIKGLNQPCAVIGSRPEVPVRGVEEALGQEVHWVDARSRASWVALGLAVPQVYFQSGWAYPAFNSLGDEVRAAGGKVCLLMDNNWRGSFRQMLGAIWFRLCQRHKFAAVLVPGKSGRRLARWYGMPEEAIFEGMYGADPQLFFNGPSLADRPKRIIFVGQYIERKGCVPLARAFASIAHRLPGWELCMYGSGPLQSTIPAHPQIKVLGFVQPEKLGALYRESRIFALPSVTEAWGLVVHEAALSGCQLLLSDAIGSAPDFATPLNARTFLTGNEKALSEALLALASEANLTAAQKCSLTMAKSHGPHVFTNQIKTINENLK